MTFKIKLKVKGLVKDIVRNYVNTCTIIVLNDSYSPLVDYIIMTFGLIFGLEFNLVMVVVMVVLAAQGGWLSLDIILVHALT